MQKLNKKLSKYISKIGVAPQQRTADWYAIRKTTIGGSEIATVIGLNPYGGVRNLIARKLGIEKFNGNPATRWGNLFEGVTQQWAEKVLQMEEGIREAGSIEGIIDRQRYSPDGLGVVRLLDDEDNPDYYIILFEFKAPFRSLPNGKIPHHYVPQIQTGMMNISLVEYSIFINNCYRKCALEDFKFNGVYDKKYHDGDYKKRKYGLERETPYACGIICFYHTMDDYYEICDYIGFGSDDDDEDAYQYMLNITENNTTNESKLANNTDEDNTYPDNFYREMDDELLLDTREALMDLGSAPERMVNRITELHDDKRVSAVYYPMVINYAHSNTLDIIETHKLEQDEKKTKDPQRYAQKCIDAFEAKCKKQNLCGIGYLPWKLMRSDIILEERDPNWEEKIRKPVEDTLTLMDKIQKSPNPIEEYYNTFPQYNTEVTTEESVEEAVSWATDIMGVIDNVDDMVVPD